MDFRHLSQIENPILPCHIQLNANRIKSTSFDKTANDSHSKKQHISFWLQKLQLTAVAASVQLVDTKCIEWAAQFYLIRQ